MFKRADFSNKRWDILNERRDISNKRFFNFFFKNLYLYTFQIR